MNIILKALKFDVYNLVALRMLYKVENTWCIAFDDFCKLDKYTKRALGESGSRLTNW